MKRLFISSLLAAISFNSFADYESGGNTVSESLLEEELRFEIGCLAIQDYSSDCDPLRGENIGDDGSVVEDTSNFNGAVYQTDPDLDTAKLNRVHFSYSGEDFSHYQNCEYLKSAISKDITDGKLSLDHVVFAQGDNGVTFGNYMNFTCAANPHLGLNIAETKISGVKHVSTGTESIEVSREATCKSSRVPASNFFVRWLHLISCRNENVTPIYEESLLLSEGGSDLNEFVGLSDGYNTSGIQFTHHYKASELQSFKYERHYDVTATPEFDNNNAITYKVDINYTLDKHRYVPIEEYEILAPVDVGGITIFVPVPPAFPNIGYSTAFDLNSSVSSKTIGQRNLANAWFGCESNKNHFLDMTQKSGTITLQFLDINDLTGCDRLSANFEKLTTNSELFWSVDLIFDEDESELWRKYALFLTEEANNTLISRTYVQALEGAAYQSESDTNAVIVKLSNYIKGNTLTGLKAYLTFNSAGLEIDSVENELARLILAGNASPYGDDILNFVDTESGQLEYTNGPNTGTVPSYWLDFYGSYYGDSVLVDDKLSLIQSVKQILTVSGFEFDTLRELISGTAEKSEDELNDTIDKITQFFAFRDDRVARGENFIAGLEGEFRELDEAAIIADTEDGANQPTNYVPNF